MKNHRKLSALDKVPNYGTLELPSYMIDQDENNSKSAPLKTWYLLHIPKAAGDSFMEESPNHLPKGSTLTGNREFSFYNTEGAPHQWVVLVREPISHVLSQFVMCKYSEWGRSKTKERDFPGWNQLDDVMAGFDEWVLHFSQMKNESAYPNLKRRNRQYFQCYNPWNHQARHMTTKRKKEPHGILSEAERIPPRDLAIHNLQQIAVVGVVQHFAVTMCLFEFQTTGTLITDECTKCDPSRPGHLQKPKQHEQTHITHDVPKHSIQMISNETRRRIELMTEVDKALHEEGLDLLHKQVEEVKNATGFDLLCRGQQGSMVMNSFVAIPPSEKTSQPVVVPVETLAPSSLSTQMWKIPTTLNVVFFFFASLVLVFAGRWRCRRLKVDTATTPTAEEQKPFISI